MSDAIELDRSTALIAASTLTAAFAFAPGGIEGIVSRIEREVRATPRDISTPAGRKAIKSLANKVARSKTALDDLGKQANESKRAEINAVDADRRVARTRLDDLKAEVLAEVEAYEAKEAAKIAAHEAALSAIVEAAGYGTTETAAELRLRLEHLRNYPPRDWDVFAERARQLLVNETARTERLLADAERREAEAAELARLLEENAARDRAEAARVEAERQAAITAAAVEAERQRVRREAEERAQAAERAAQAERSRIEQERLASESRERQAIADREAAEQRARDAEEAGRRAVENARLREEQAATDAEARRVQAAAEAERRRVDAERAAVLAEQQRVAREQEAAAEAQRQREANVAHQRKINREALADLMKVNGVTEEIGTAVIVAIAKRLVRHVGVSY